MINENIQKNNTENNDQCCKDTMAEAILYKINSGEVNMKPKVFFKLSWAALVFTSLMFLFTSAVLVSFIIFSIRVSGEFFLLGFGSKGLYIFILTFPWLILLMDLAFILILEALLKQFKFGYKIPMAYLFLGSIAIVTLIGLVIDRTNLHNELQRQSRQGGLPIFNDTYKNANRPPKGTGLFKGFVTDVSTSTFIIKANDYDLDPDEGLKIVRISPDWQNIIQIKKGDYLFIAGEMVGSEIKVYGIRRLSTSTDEF